jgi:Spy/CpxP family protein refolding chaperone
MKFHFSSTRPVLRLALAAALLGAASIFSAPAEAAEALPWCSGTRGSVCDSKTACAGFPGTDIQICTTTHTYWE